MTLDFQRIWNAQGIDEVLRRALGLAAAEVNADLINPPQGISNISEWAKKDGAWTRLLDKADRIAELLSEEFFSSLASSEISKFEMKSAKQTQKLDNGIEAQRAVLAIPAASWAELCERMKAKRLLTPKEIGIMSTACQMPSKIPSEKQSVILLELLEKGRADGISVLTLAV